MSFFGSIDEYDGFKCGWLGCSAYEALGMCLPGVVQHDATRIAYLLGAPVTDVGWGEQRDAAVSMLVVVSWEERVAEIASLMDVGEVVREHRPVFERFELRFTKRVVV